MEWRPFVPYVWASTGATNQAMAFNDCDAPGASNVEIKLGGDVVYKAMDTTYKLHTTDNNWKRPSFGRMYP